MDYRNLLLTNQHLQDLNPLIAGEERCKPGHSFGPAVRKYTLIHYVFRGKGTLYSRGQEHPVQAGQAFLILPGEVTTYCADMDDPWHYCWIGFDGALSTRFQELPPVFSVSDAPFRIIMDDNSGKANQEHRLCATLFELYSLLFCENPRINPHVRRVKDYIQASYMHPIRVEQIAQELSLDRRYLSRLFKEHTGQSIQEYIINIRLLEAEQYLLQGYSVQESANLAGYPDVSNFSKIYKKHRGSSPATVRKM